MKNAIQNYNENEILALGNAFLTNGFHNLKVYDIEEGRFFLETFTKSHIYFNSIACLTTSSVSLDESVHNLYKELAVCSGITQDVLDAFILEEFYYDFLWIEATKELLKEKWVNIFKRRLMKFKLDNYIPIFTFSYEIDDI